MPRRTRHSSGSPSSPSRIDIRGLVGGWRRTAAGGTQPQESRPIATPGVRAGLAPSTGRQRAGRELAASEHQQRRLRRKPRSAAPRWGSHQGPARGPSPCHVIARQLVHDRTEGPTADRRRRHHARGARQRALLLVVAPALRHLLGRTDLSTGGSLLAVGVLHASFNASGSLDVLDGGWQHIVGLAVVAALTLIADVVRSRGTHDARTSSAAQCYTFLISVTPGREIAPAFHVRRVAGRRRYGSAGVSSSAHETASLPFSERIGTAGGGRPTSPDRRGR